MGDGQKGDRNERGISQSLPEHRWRSGEEGFMGGGRRIRIEMGTQERCWCCCSSSQMHSLDLLLHLGQWRTRPHRAS